MHHAVIEILALLLVAAFVGIGARRLQLPYTLALVLSGIGLGFLHVGALDEWHLTPDLLLTLFLPALLFEAAWHLHFDQFRRDAVAILAMAVPGVLVAVGVTAGLSWLLLGAVGAEEYTLGLAFLAASVISATDPISVLALFKTLGVPKRLYVLVEGESLVNDGVAVVVFLIVAAVLGIETGHGHAPHLAGASEVAIYGIKTFVWMAAGGIVIGGLSGAAASVITRTVDDRLVEVALTTIVAYGSFMGAEEVHASGVLSCLAAGVVMGSFGAHYGMSPLTRLAVTDFWGYMAFFSNTFIFLLIGLELDVPDLLGAGGLVLLLFFSVLVARTVVVYLTVPLASLARSVQPVPMSWRHVMVWGGLRGSLSMVLVVGLPQEMPGRKLLVLLIFGVVSVSLLLQGLTMKPLMERLGLASNKGGSVDYEKARGASLMAARALDEIEARARKGTIQPGVSQQLGAWYRDRHENNAKQAEALAGSDLGFERLQEQALHLLSVEEDALVHLVAEGVLSEEAGRTLGLDLAARREALAQGGWEALTRPRED